MAKRFEELELIFKAEFPDAGKTIELPEDEAVSQDKAIPQDEEAPRKKVVPREEKGFFVISNIIFYTILAALVGCALWFSIGGRAVQFYEVLTDSMQSVYPKGSLVVATQVMEDELTIGDDIAFLREDGEFVVLRISEVVEDEADSGGRAFIASGIDDKVGNEEMIKESAVIGRVKMGIPLLGAITTRINNHPEIILAIAIIMAILVMGIKLLWDKKLKLSIVFVILVGMLCLTNETEVFAQWTEERSEETKESAKDFEATLRRQPEQQSEATTNTMADTTIDTVTDATTGTTTDIAIDTTTDTTIDTATDTITDTTTDTITDTTEIATAGETTAGETTEGLAPTSVAEINQEPADETKPQYMREDIYPPGIVVYADVGRSFIILALGLVSIKIIGNIFEGLKDKIDKKSKDSG